MAARFGYISLVLGAAALIMALVHFWAGPFAPQPTLEEAVAETAVGIREAAINALRGGEKPEPKPAEWDIDKTVSVGTAVAGGAALILALVGFVRHEPKRPVIAGATLGVGAIVFQFAAWMVLALVFAILARCCKISRVSSVWIRRTAKPARKRAGGKPGPFQLQKQSPYDE